MSIVAVGGAGGFGGFAPGGDGGDAGQAGEDTYGGGVKGGAAGSTPGAAGGTGNTDQYHPGAGGGGGANGTSASQTGGNGGNGGDAGTMGNRGVGGGGGGGGGAGYVAAGGLTGTAGLQAKGGDGGNGGGGGPANNSTYVEPGGSGGNGGQGGDGAELTGTGQTATIAAGATYLGGNGGTGGTGSVATSFAPAGQGGNGGAGGDGFFAYDGNAIANAGLIRGGSGGVGGASADATKAGRIGLAGTGIVGSNMSLTNSGTIAGGLGFSAATNGDAIRFTSGNNVLTLSAAGVVGAILGNIQISGALDIKSGGVAATLGGGTLVLGAGAAVSIESGVTLADVVAGFAAGDTIDFVSAAYSTKLEVVFTASAGGGSVRIVDSTHPTNVVASFNVVGAFATGVFGVMADGSGGSKIGLTATPPLGIGAGDTVTSNIPGSSALAVVDRYNADYSLYEEATITKLSNGSYTYHFQGGSFFNGKSFAAFDNSVTAAGQVTAQTLYNGAGQTIQQTQFNANGTIYLQDNVVYPAAGQVLYQYRNGTFFTGKTFSAFDNLATTGNNTLLEQELYNRDGSHTFTVPGSGLTLTAVKADTFNVSGGNETTRFNATGFGADTFNGYKAGDVFSFSTSIFANYQALQQHLSGSSSAVITTAANDTLTLANVAKSSLTSSMFTFS